MQRSAVLLILTTVLALVGLAPTRAESAPARGGYGVGFYGPHIRFGIGFHGYRYYPRFSYRYSRPHRYSYYRANPYYSRHYYRPELYVGAYPSATYVGDVPAAVEFGRVAAAPVNTLRQQTHRCQEISVCF